jgi:hypothetical protein
MTRILVATFPHAGDVCFGFARWLSEEARLAAGRGDRLVAVEFPGAHLAMQRNRAVSFALRHGMDYLVQVDADQIPPDNVIEAALTAMPRHGACVACLPTVTANRRVPIWIGEPPVTVDLDTARHMRNVTEVKRGNGGFILTANGIFRSLEPPWFRDDFEDKGMTDRRRGQDVYFYDKVRAAGHKIICLWNFWMEHFKPVGLLDRL